MKSFSKVQGIITLKFLYALLGLLKLISDVDGLPITKNEEKDTPSNPDPTSMLNTLEYKRYLDEVVQVLEHDSNFRKKLDEASHADIESGNIANELEFVDHHVRTRLDEIKRRELERLRTLANQQYERSNDIDRNHLKVLHTHLDHENEHTFEIEDLHKLITKTSKDLAKADNDRRQEFKKYEMKKKLEQEIQMKKMNEVERNKYDMHRKEQEENHKKHEKVHQPGNKAQLEEVWKKQDHMDGQNFDPHSFFTIHDVDGNGFWDETEVKALFIKELDKVYQIDMEEDDMREREEEMERMREYVFKKTDINHDGLISYEEFLEQTKREEFQMDPEWDTLDRQRQYTNEEFQEYERKHLDEVQPEEAQKI